MTGSAGAPERIALASIGAQPWKNGAGFMRELAVEPIGAGTSDFDWRISLAEVARDAPFSAFPNVDRCITLLRGSGMRLTGAAGSVDHRLDRALVPLAFRGDDVLAATLLDGPCSDFNVMTRRGAWRAEVRPHHSAFEPTASEALLLFGVNGTWQIDARTADHDDAWSIAADQALLWRRVTSPLRATPIQSGATLLAVRLCHDCR